MKKTTKEIINEYLEIKECGIGNIKDDEFMKIVWEQEVKND